MAIKKEGKNNHVKIRDEIRKILPRAMPDVTQGLQPRRTLPDMTIFNMDRTPVFRCAIRSDDARLCNDAECAFFRKQCLYTI